MADRVTGEELARIERDRIVLAGECGASDGYAKCTEPEGHGPAGNRRHWDKHTQHEWLDDEPVLPQRKGAPSELKIMHMHPAAYDDLEARRGWQRRGYAVLRGVAEGLSGYHPVGGLCDTCSRTGRQEAPRG